jgi:hypothetical protein
MSDETSLFPFPVVLSTTSNSRPHALSAKMAPPTTTLSSLFPLTSPTPSPLTNPSLVHPSSIPTEEDLCLNPENFKTWWSLITATRDRLALEEKREEDDLALKEEGGEEGGEAAVLGPLRLVAVSQLIVRLIHEDRLWGRGAVLLGTGEGYR